MPSLIAICADDQVGGYAGQRMEYRVVRRADGATQAGLHRPPRLTFVKWRAVLIKSCDSKSQYLGSELRGGVDRKPPWRQGGVASMGELRHGEAEAAAGNDAAFTAS